MSNTHRVPAEDLPGLLVVKAELAGRLDEGVEVEMEEVGRVHEVVRTDNIKYLLYVAGSSGSTIG